MGQAKTKELHASADATLRIKVVRQEDNSESEVDVAANETVATFRQRFFMKTLLEQPLLSLSQRFVDVDVTPYAERSEVPFHPYYHRLPRGPCLHSN